MGVVDRRGGRGVSLATPLVALVCALGLSLLLAVGWLGAPGQDVADLLLYLLLSGVASLALGGAAAAWLRRGRAPLWAQITVAYTLGVAIALFNVLLTARLMFISEHDQLLLSLLLLFAAVVSTGLGVELAAALTRRVAELHRGARALGAGNLGARVTAAGGDELAELAREFNRMAALLEESTAARDQAETARHELIAAVSHDLRTPLASLSAMTEALADGVVSDAETTARYLAAMRAQIGRLSALIDDLFALSQIDAGQLRLDRQPIAPADLVSDLIEGLHPQAAACGVALRGSVAPGVGVVPLDTGRIERVLGNLVTNALRHTPAGGSVEVRVGPGARGSAVFEVRDSGSGIAPEDLPRVFDRFYRGEKSRSRATGGAGLGLAIARGIVEAHGGQITIDSVPGEGTSVRFLIPAGPPS